MSNGAKLLNRLAKLTAVEATTMLESDRGFNALRAFSAAGGGLDTPLEDPRMVALLATLVTLDA